MYNHSPARGHWHTFRSDGGRNAFSPPSDVRLLDQTVTVTAIPAVVDLTEEAHSQQLTSSRHVEHDRGRNVQTDKSYVRPFLCGRSSAAAVPTRDEYTRPSHVIQLYISLNITLHACVLLFSFANIGRTCHVRGGTASSSSSSLQAGRRGGERTARDQTRPDSIYDYRLNILPVRVLCVTHVDNVIRTCVHACLL